MTDGPPVVWEAPASQEAATTPTAMAALLWPLFQGQWQELFLVVCLDSQCRPAKVIEVARGGVDHCDVDPRIVFRATLAHGASRIALAHNHPSGDPTPSIQDRQLTRRLQAAGTMLGIEVVDHIVMGGAADWVSFAEENA